MAAGRAGPRPGWRANRSTSRAPNRAQDWAVATVAAAAVVILVAGLVGLVSALPRLQRADPSLASAAATVAGGAPPVEIVIPALGVNAPVVPLGLDAQGAMDVPQDPQAAGWYRFGPRPAEVGPAVIAGHVDWRGEPGVFAKLETLRPGDRVTVTNAAGTSAAFTVTAIEQHTKDAFPTERVYGDTAAPELRLITCGGAFDRSRRHYRDNVIVFASAM